MLISANSITQAFAGKTLFQNLKMGLFTNERVGLIGPNGVGKTTLFKILSKKLIPDGGEVVWRKGLRLGYLEQSPHFSSQTTILEAILEKAPDKEHSVGEAYALMSKLDLLQFGESFLVAQLSGGWQKRVALARELILEPDILFMDEPTNHLDVSGILWLEEFIEKSSFSLFMITHDQLFLERTCQKFIDLDPKNPDFILIHEGDFASYIENKEMLLQGQLQKEKSLANVLRRETEWLRRGAKARQTKQKGRIQRAAEIGDEVERLQQKNKTIKLDFDFTSQEKSPKKLIEIEKVTKKYEDRVLFENFDLTIHQKTRLAIMGDNGCGKSTLIKILSGVLEPDSGSVKITQGIKILSFEQNRDTLQKNKSLLKNICPEGDYVHFQGRYIHVQSYLDQFLFTRAQTDLPVERLSGGEQARVRIAQLMLQEANVLFLDEPTNDLDRTTLQVLQESLNNFNGAVVLVTHDRYFMDQVAQQILAFPPKNIKQKLPLQFFSDYFQWEEWFKAITEDERFISEKSSSGNSGSNSVVDTSVSIPTKLSFKEKKDLETMETQILTKETELKQLQDEIQKPELVANSTLLNEKCILISKLEEEITQMYQRWSDLENKQKLIESNKSR